MSCRPRFVAKHPVHNRRKFKVPKGIVHPLVFTKAESIPGYEKFTLDEVIYPEKEVEVKNLVKLLAVKNFPEIFSLIYLFKEKVLYPQNAFSLLQAKERSDDVSEEDIVVVDTTEVKKDESAVSSNSKAKKVGK